MEALQTLFDQYCKNFIIEDAIDIIASKVAMHGIALSRRQKRLLRQKLETEDASTIHLYRWRPWSKKGVTVEITDEDITTIEDDFKKWLNSVPDLIETISDALSNDICTTLKRKWAKGAVRQQRREAAFQRRLHRKWRRPLDLLSLLLVLSQEFGDAANSRLRRHLKELGPHLVDAITRLHARGCQVSSEIMVLLRAGLADGAMARWRTLHEIVVTTLLLYGAGNDVAERYLLHDAIQSWKAATQYQEHCAALGSVPIPQREIDRLGGVKDALVKRCGEDYKSDYGWAASYIGNKNPRFASIEKVVGIAHLRPYYKMASDRVHANAKGMLFQIGILEEQDLLLAGPSAFGLADPGQSAAISLAHVTITLAQLKPTLDTVVFMRIIEELAEETVEAFVKTQEAIETNR
jgi:hypothetical protein